jgi:hypothetical protein
MSKIVESKKRAVFNAKKSRFFKAMENLEIVKRKKKSKSDKIDYLIKNQRASEALINALEAEKERTKEVIERARKKGKTKICSNLELSLSACDVLLEKTRKQLRTNQLVLENELKK